jgi:hypothetical protein
MHFSNRSIVYTSGMQFYDTRMKHIVKYGKSVSLHFRNILKFNVDAMTVRALLLQFCISPTIVKQRKNVVPRRDHNHIYRKTEIPLFT